LHQRSFRGILCRVVVAFVDHVTVIIFNAGSRTSARGLFTESIIGQTHTVLDGGVEFELNVGV